MSRILAIGNATLDIINRVEYYPHEDDEVRATDQSISRGGNATNSLVVLSQLGHQCSWAGVLASDCQAVTILQDLKRYHINCDYVVEPAEGKTPISCIFRAKSKATRTIVHYRNLREYQWQDFNAVNVADFDWIHCEARNTSQLLLILETIKQSNQHIPISIEVEKPRDQLEKLYPYASSLFFSKSFVINQGFNTAYEFLTHMHQRYPKTTLCCAWSEQGAYAIGAEAKVFYAPALADINIVDTVGAGDVFNAAIIHSTLQQSELAEALQHACQLAGKKCSQQGFADLV